jgi:hypothetical protein
MTTSGIFRLLLSGTGKEAIFSKANLERDSTVKRKVKNRF